MSRCAVACFAVLLSACTATTVPTSALAPNSTTSTVAAPIDTTPTTVPTQTELRTGTTYVPLDELDLTGRRITVLGPETGAAAEALTAAFGVFEAQTGASVDYNADLNAASSLEESISAGATPDVVLIPQPGRLVDLASRGVIVALPTELNDILGERFDPTWADLASVGGAVFGVPTKVDVKSVVWYRSDIFEQRGYSIPETWTELETLEAQIRADSLVPWCLAIGSGSATGWVVTDWIEDAVLSEFGPALYDEWVRHRIPFNDARIERATRRVERLLSTPGNVLGGRDRVVTESFIDAGVPLVDGECLMHRQASFYGTTLAANGARLSSTDRIDVFGFPRIDGSVTNAVMGAGTFAAATTDTPEVWALIEHLMSPEHALTRITASGGGYLSPNRLVTLDAYSRPIDRRLAEILADAEAFRFDGSDLMPAAVGSGEFWSAATDFAGGAIDSWALLDRVEAAWP